MIWENKKKLSNLECWMPSLFFKSKSENNNVAYGDKI